MACKYSERVAKAYADVSIGDYYVDQDGHWLTLKDGYHRDGGQIVHEWSARDMLAARSDVKQGTVEPIYVDGVKYVDGIKVEDCAMSARVPHLRYEDQDKAASAMLAALKLLKSFTVAYADDDTDNAAWVKTFETVDAAIAQAEAAGIEVPT
jgi:hypothetical protein